MDSGAQIIKELGEHGVRIYLEDCRFKVWIPWTTDETPPEVKSLLDKLRNHAAQIADRIQEVS